MDTQIPNPSSLKLLRKRKSPTRLQSRIFNRTLALLAAVLTVATIIQLGALVVRDRDKQMEELDETIAETTQYVAHGAWQVNRQILSLVMQSTLLNPQVKMSEYVDHDINLHAVADGYSTQDWKVCDEVISVDFTGYIISGYPLPEGMWRVCYVNTINFKTLSEDFISRLIPLLLLAVLMSLAFSRMMSDYIVSPVERLSRHIAQQKPIETYQRASPFNEPDEFDDLVDELKHRTKELKRERHIIEQFFPEISDAIVQVDQNYHIMRYNQALVELVDASELEGADLTQLFPEEYLQADGKRKEFRDAQDRILEIKPSALRDDDGVIYFIRDITFERNKQEQEIHAGKLRALGTLAGGIAHDYNNLLAIIISNAEILASFTENAEEQQELVDNMIHAASRGASLSNQLLTFARKRSINTNIVEANRVAENVHAMVQTIIGKTVSIQLYPQSKSSIEIDIGLIESALMNLVVNAKDATPKGGGEISLTIKDVNHSGKPYVVFIVKDSGTGMPADVLERVRDPFFTTKSLGKGTGLGLSIVSSFAEQFGGFLDIHSQYGIGTKVSLYLPKYDAATSVAIAEEGPEEIAKAPPRKILVIDDEPSLCKILAMLLTRDGHHVDTATTFAEFYNKELAKNAYDLVVCDVLLERETAYDVWLEFQGANNIPPFALISGNVPEVVFKEIKHMHCPHLLIKPFHNQDFSDYVSKVLNEIDAAKNDEIREIEAV